MSCYHPFKAWAPLSKADGGRYVFDATKALNPDSPAKFPCGRCIGCRQDRVSDWMVRSVHEAASHPSNCFITLTYSDEHVPSDFSVKLRDFQLFMKRLRKRFGAGVRFFGCGEYGEATLRPHYHALLFNFDFSDKTFYMTRNGHRVFKSEALQELWPFGLCEIGSVTAESAGYCSQYVQKKRTGPVADDHYWRISPVDGQAHRVAPEFATMSRRPGLGVVWFDRFSSDVFPSDHVIIDGTPRRTPLFYSKRLKAAEAAVPIVPSKFFKELASVPSNRIKRARVVRASARKADATPERLAVREFIHASRLKRLVRAL